MCGVKKIFVGNGKCNYLNMKICHVLWNGGIGGIESVVTSLAVSMREENEVRIVFGKRAGLMESVLNQHKIQFSEIELNNGADIRFSKYQKCVQFFNTFDIIHLHVYNPLFLFASIRSNAKVVYSMHSLTHLRRKKTWSDRLNSLIQSIGLSYVSVVTTVSKFAERELGAELSKLAKLVVVPNGIKIESAVKIADSKLLNIISYGRLTSNKRFELLLQTVRELVSIDPKLLCRIYGEGPEKNKLKVQIEQMNLQKYVEILDFTDDIHHVIDWATVGIFPFQAESCGLSALETFSRGLPTFTLQDGGGQVEFLERSTFPLVANNVEQLAGNIVKYLSLDVLQKEKQQKEWVELSKEYDVDVILQRYIELYKAC